MKQKPLITKPSYPRSFEPSLRPAKSDSFADNSEIAWAKLEDETQWEFMVATLKAIPEYAQINGFQHIYDMLLDALDKLQDSESRLAALRDEFQSYKQTIRSAAH